MEHMSSLRGFMVVWWRGEGVTRGGRGGAMAGKEGGGGKRAVVGKGSRRGRVKGDSKRKRREEGSLSGPKNRWWGMKHYERALWWLRRGLKTTEKNTTWTIRHHNESWLVSSQITQYYMSSGRIHHKPIPYELPMTPKPNTNLIPQNK